PRSFGSIGSVELTKDRFLLLAFAILMIGGALAMIRKPGAAAKRSPSPWVMAVLGGLVGFVTGMVGAGGGFLIVPVLVCFAGLEMKSAIGASLSIIAVNSVIGFSTFIVRGGKPDWSVLAGVLGSAIGGLFLGLWLSQRLSGAKLKPAFGAFVLGVACFIFARELLF
ncbi:MAG: sulfite exporter TauE/SafE family protein, partial [Fimbriimonadaceae bacterium]